MGGAVTARSARSAMLICFLVVFHRPPRFGIVLPLLPASPIPTSASCWINSRPCPTRSRLSTKHTELIGYYRGGTIACGPGDGRLAARGKTPIQRAAGGAAAMVRPLGWRFALGSAALGPVVLTFFPGHARLRRLRVTPFSLLLEDAFVLRQRQAVLMFAYVGLVLLIAQGFIYRRLAKRLSEVAFMALGILFMGAGVALLGLSVTMQAYRQSAEASTRPGRRDSPG